MTGDKSVSLYIDALLGVVPNFETKEEEEHYWKVHTQIEQAKKQYGPNIMFEIPDD